MNEVMPKELATYSIFLMIFILINFGIYFLIQLKGPEIIFRKLCIYWLSIFIVFIFEGIFTEGKLALSLVFLVNLLPIILMSSFLLEMYNHKIHRTLYIAFLPVAIIATVMLAKINAPFFVVSLPALLLNSGPVLELLYIVLTKKDERKMEKAMIAAVALAGLFSCLYYALFRYTPTPTQYYIGFGSAFISYLFCSILLPILCIQLINKKKTQYLEDQVAEQTKELRKSKQEKEDLLRVLVHDISNPLQSIMIQSRQIKKTFSVLQNDSEHNYSERIDKNILAIKEIISYVREYESILSGKRTVQLKEVLLSDCLKEIEDLFSESFKAKRVVLNVHNKLPLDTKIKVDKTPFVHSVTSNLVSNALKFSHPDSEVNIEAYEKDNQIVLDFIDHGIGISNESLQKIFDITASTSRRGTMGEQGTGFGLPIVKAYTSMFGGKILIYSSEEIESSGTTISLQLPKTNGLDSLSSNQTFLQ
jgi:nitrogen-specific signal transduction histidine kinase